MCTVRGRHDRPGRYSVTIVRNIYFSSGQSHVVIMSHGALIGQVIIYYSKVDIVIVIYYGLRILAIPSLSVRPNLVMPSNECEESDIPDNRIYVVT